LTGKSTVKRIEALEAEILPHVKEEDPPEIVMYKVITAEWVEAWKDTGEEHIEDAIDDWIARLKACPVTARLGTQIASYREVLIEHLRDCRARSESSHRDESEEYEESAG
jgi:hypothetical protein